MNNKTENGTSSTKLVIALHEKAKGVTKELKQKEWEVILVLQEVIKYQVYRKYKYPSLYKYLTLSLGLSETQAQDFSVVAHSSLRFEKLHAALAGGKISISKARRITSVLNQDNQEEWISKARLNTHRSLEQLVAAKNPEVSFFESARYVSENQVEVKMAMSEKEYRDFKRAQDLLCQKQKKPVSMKNTLVQTARDYLEKHDPVKKAMRFEARKLKKALTQRSEIKTSMKSGTSLNQKPLTTGGSTTPKLKPLTAQTSGTCQKLNLQEENSGQIQKSAPSEKGRRPIPLQIFYQVQLRDRGQCQKNLPNGLKCPESKWTDIHHVKPVHQGGDNSLQNLMTLCKGHHQLEHL